MLKKNFTLPLMKYSPRDLSEQFLGLGIIAIATTAFAALNTWLSNYGTKWIESLHTVPWMLPISWHYQVCGIVHATMAVSFWSIWRLESLRTLKIEFALFMSLLAIETIWSGSLFALKEPMLSLIALVIWMCGTFALTALFWKKDKISAIALGSTLLWIFYQISINLMLCIGTP